MNSREAGTEAESCAASSTLMDSTSLTTHELIQKQHNIGNTACFSRVNTEITEYREYCLLFTKSATPFLLPQKGTPTWGRGRGGPYRMQKMQQVKSKCLLIREIKIFGNSCLCQAVNTYSGNYSTKTGKRQLFQFCVKSVRLLLQKAKHFRTVLMQKKKKNNHYFH